jgi:hypothetical protein
MGDTKLRASVKIDGAGQATKDLKGVAAAQREVTGEVKGAGQEAAQAADAQQKLTASESDFIGVLSRINPALGGLADALLKGGKIAGDLASQNISLSGAFQKATGAIKANAGALKLIGAGGAVVVAIGLIAGAMAKMREEALAVTAAIKDQVDALNDLQKQRSTQSENLERMSAKRHEGPLTADESRAAQQTVAGLGDVAGVNARQQAVLLGGTGLSKEILQRLSVLIENFPEDVDFERSIRYPPEERIGGIERRLARRAEPLDVIMTREKEQRGEAVGTAQGQARAGSGATASIAEFIKNLPGRGMEGVDPDELARIVQGLQGLGPEQLDRAEGAIAYPGGGKDVRSREYADLQRKGAALKKEGVEGASPQLIRLAEMVLQQLNQAADRLDEAAGKLLESGGGTVINNQNAKFIGPDAASQKASTINGENRSRRQSERML